MKKINKYRLYIQLFFLTLIVLILIFLGNSKTHLVCPNYVNCVLLSNLQTPLFIISIGFVLSIIIILSTIFYGRYFCGYVCPIGTIQDLVGFKAKRKYPKSLFYLKYLILITTSIGSYLSGKIIYQKVCPVEMLAGKIPYYEIGFALFTIIIILSIFWKRFFCVTLCPYGALLNVFQTITYKISNGKFPKSLAPKNCLSCGICKNNCPMGISVYSKDVFDTIECIRCSECLEVCPIKKKEAKSNE